MAYKKYIKRGDKVFGPYIYESVKENGRVKTNYLGKHKSGKIGFIKNKNFLIISSVLMILLLGIFLVYFFDLNLGKTGLAIQTNYEDGENLKGNLEISLKKGELLPISTRILIDNSGEISEFFLSDLISNDVFEGSFYIDGKNISGSGQGYGVVGEKITYPEVFFTMKILESDETDSGASDGSEIVIPDVTDDETTEEPQTPTTEDQSTETTTEEPQTPTTEDQSTETPTEESTTEEPSTIEEPSESSEPEPSPITGEAILNDLIDGVVTKNSLYEYTLGQDQTAEIVSSTQNVELSIKNKKVEVTTGYFEAEKGFGEDYLTEEEVVILVNLEALNLLAKKGKLEVSFIYNEEEVYSIKENIKVGAKEQVIKNDTQIEIPEQNFTKANVTDMNITYENETIVNITERNFTIETIQYGAVLGQPVKWKKNIVLNEFKKDITVKLPKEAKNINVYKIVDKEKYKEDVREFDEEDVSLGDEENSEDLNESLVVNEYENFTVNESEQETPRVSITAQVITGEMSAEINLEEKKFSFASFFQNIFSFLTGRVVDVEETIESRDVVINETLLIGATGIEIEYETPAPISFERETSEGKEILISSDTHYENILAYTFLEEEAPISSIKLYRLVNKTVEKPIDLGIPEEEFSSLDPSELNKTELVTIYGKEAANIINYQDFNNNSLVDYIEWVVPSLSNQTYLLVIEISNAEHLDTNRNFISNIYGQVNALDNAWSESINQNEYVRVTFEKDLDNTKDITVFVRGNGSIEVYEFNKTELIADFGEITENQYNTVYLTNLSGTQNVFDLKIVRGSLEFDHIIDPTYEISNVSINGIFDNTVYESDGFTHLNLSDRDIVLYLPFEGVNKSNNVLDWSDNDLYGTSYSTTPYVDGYDGLGANFSNTHGYVTFNDSASLDITQAMALSVWYRPTNVSGVQVIAGKCSNPWSQNSYVMFQSAAYVYCYFNDGAGRQLYTIAFGPLVVGTWNHFVCAFDGASTLKSYWDGVLKSTNTTTAFGNILITTTNFTVGSIQSTYAPQGTIDEVMIINKSLSAADVKGLYNATYERFKPVGNLTVNQTIASGNNRVNITISTSNQNSTSNNISLRIYDGTSWTAEQNMTSGVAVNFPISTSATVLNLSFGFIPDVNKFWSPILLDGVTITAWGSTPFPNVNIIFPSNNTITSNTALSINYTYGNATTCWYSNDTMTVNTTLVSCANITTITWSQGQHNVTIWANDSINNIDSSMVAFTIVNAVCGDTITASKTLNANLSCAGETAIIIGASNIELNCAGHKIRGDNTTTPDTYGVYVLGRNNITIKNCTILDFEYQIGLFNSTNSVIYLNNVSSYNSNNKNGIYLFNSSNNNLTSNKGISNSSSGIDLDYSNNNILTNNTGIADGGVGIGLTGSLRNNLTSNRGISNSGYGIYLYSSSNNNLLINNSGTSDSLYGIYLYDSISNNTLTNNSGISNSSYGILLSTDANNNTLTKNIGRSSSNVGFYLYKSSNNTLINNIGTSNLSAGIFLSTDSNNNTLVNNSGISNSNNGIYIYLSNKNVLINNTGTSNSSFATYLFGANDTLLINHRSEGFLPLSYGVGLVANAKNNIFQDCINISGGNADVYVFSEGAPGTRNNTFLNCSYRNNGGNESVNGVNDDITRKWYYRAYVNNSVGAGISGANLIAWNASGSIEFTNLLTNASGWTNITTITEYVNVGGTKRQYSNYTINASAGGYYVTLSKSENITLLLNQYKDVFTLIALPYATYTISNVSIDGKFDNTNYENGFTHLNVSDKDIVFYSAFDVNGDSIAYDWSENNNDCTISQAVWNATGIEGYSYNFDGVDDYMTCGNGASLNFNKGFTVSAWVYVTGDVQSKNEGRTVVSKDNPSGGQGWNFGAIWDYGNDRFETRVYDNSGIQRALSSEEFYAAANQNQWRHVVGVYSPSNYLRNYIDGELDGQDSTVGSAINSTSALLNIGRTSHGNSEFKGLIDEVIIWNRTLSYGEISAVYNSSYARFKPVGNLTLNQTIASGNNIVNVTILTQNQNFTSNNISLKIYDGTSWTAEQNITNGLASEFSIGTSATILNLSFGFIPDVNKFWSPILLDGVTINVWSSTPVPNVNIIFPSNNTITTNIQLPVNYTYGNATTCWYSNDTMTVNTTLVSCANITTITWSQGQHNVTIWANDSINNIDSSMVAFKINTAPSMNSSRIYSVTNFTSDSLQGYCNASDASNDTLSYFYEWYKNNELFSFGSFSDYTGSVSQVGEFVNLSLDGPDSVFVQDEYAYVVNLLGDSLHIIDISVKDPPTQIGYFQNYSESMYGASDVFVLGDYAYVVAEYNDSLVIINITSKSTPKQIGFYSNSSSINWAEAIFVQGDYAYIASNYGPYSFAIINITSKTSPTQVVSIENVSALEGANDVFVLGDYAYVAATSNDTLTIIDVSSKTSPVEVGHLKNTTSLDGAISVHVDGDYAYVVGAINDSLTIINITSKTSPTQVGYFTNTSSLNNPYSLYVAGSYAYISSLAGDSLTVIDISSKTSPTQVGYFKNSTSLSSAVFVYVSGNYAYVTGYTNSSLVILDIANGFTQGVEVNVNNISSSELNLFDDWILSCEAYDDSHYSGWLNSNSLRVTEGGYPNITFTTGTPNNASSQSNADIFVNVSAADALSNISTFIDFDNSLVGWWRMDDLNSSGDVVDYLGKNNGSVAGATQTTSGYFGRAFDFDESDNITIEDSVSTSFGTGITVSAWINPNSCTPFSSNHNSVVVKENEFLLGFQTDCDMANYIYVADWTGDLPTANKIPIGTWSHYVITYNGSKIITYFNGIAQSVGTTKTGSVNNAATPIGIGKRIGSGSPGSYQNFNGSIDDVMIFNRSLTANEIKALYANKSSEYLTNNFTGLAHGAHVFRAYTQDLAGNVNSTEQRSVNIFLNSCLCVNSTSWEIDNSNYCNLTDDCNLGAGMLNFTGAGVTTCNATIYTSDLGDPGATGTFVVGSECNIWVS